MMSAGVPRSSHREAPAPGRGLCGLGRALISFFFLHTILLAPAPPSVRLRT